MHASGHLREAFADWVHAGKDEHVIPADFFLDGEERPIPWLFGHLWGCTDIMPSALCSNLDIPKGSTYAKAVQREAASTPAWMQPDMPRASGYSVPVTFERT